MTSRLLGSCSGERAREFKPAPASAGLTNRERVGFVLLRTELERASPVVEVRPRACENHATNAGAVIVVMPSCAHNDQESAWSSSLLYSQNTWSRTSRLVASPRSRHRSGCRS